MPEPTQPTPATDATPTEESDEVRLNWLQRFTINKPRTAKVVAVTTAAVATVAGLVVVNTVSKNRHHVDAAKDHARDAVGEIGEAVSPSPETAA